jgi:hypothetical protein
MVIFCLSPAVLPNSASAQEHRSSAVAREFQREHPCPSTGQTSGACPGWIKDHIRALKCGGPDDPANIQWQTVAEAKAKDKWELDCARGEGGGSYRPEGATEETNDAGVTIFRGSPSSEQRQQRSGQGGNQAEAQ